MRVSGPCFSSAGKMPSPPGDLYGPNLAMAHLTLENVTILLASDQLSRSALGHESASLLPGAPDSSLSKMHPGKCVSRRSLRLPLIPVVNCPPGDLKDPRRPVGLLARMRCSLAAALRLFISCVNCLQVFFLAFFIARLYAVSALW